MNNKRKEKNAVRSGKKTCLYVGGTYSVIIEMRNFDPAIYDDKIILESEDGSYDQTLEVMKEYVHVEEDRYRFTFTGVRPGKRYTLTYDLGKDSEGNKLGVFTMFKALPIEPRQMDTLKPVEHDLSDEKGDKEWMSEFGLEESRNM